ncbi:MAG: ParB/RepB/Spo0J family partition protein [Bacilli bacterium]|nr:ParB/RepB/Spo0J family partition protein [Bacilli bacterium]
MNENVNETLNKEIVQISVEDIIPNRFQPRLTFDVEALNELANSIKEHGIIQPLVVRKLQDKYEIIAGERRYKAAVLNGMIKVPCIVMNLNDNESAEVAVIENIQRKEMTPLEEAKSYKKILDKGYLTQEELARKMGKSQSNIANKLRLLNLDDVVQEAILNGKISERHARSLLKVESKQEQRNILSEIIEKRLTVRQTDELIKEKFGIGVERENMNVNMNNSVNSENSIFKSPVVEEKQVDNNIINNDPYASTPQVILPTNSNVDMNPQMKILNNLEKSNDNSNQPIIQQTNDIFKTNTIVSHNIDNNEINKPDIQSVINPSVLSTPTQEVSYNNGMNVDVNRVKNMAQDIMPKEEKPINVPNLMSTDSSKPENKFFVDLDIPDDMMIKKEQLPFKVQSAIDSINRRVEDIKLQGTHIIKEEKDLGNTYEIVIRIDK